MSEILIREAQDFELDTCASVIRESFATVAAEYGLTKENCPTNGAFMKTGRLRAQREQGRRQYALTSDGIVIGFAELEEKTDRVYELQKLAVLPRYRHCGYGKMLLDFAKERAKSWGCVKITIGVIEENIRLKNWYARNGFVHTGTQRFEHLPFVVGYMEYQL